MQGVWVGQSSLLSWPGFLNPKLYPGKPSASPTLAPLGLGSCGLQAQDHCLHFTPPQPQAYCHTLPPNPRPGAQKQGLLSIAAPSIYYCLRRPPLVLSEVPFMDMSLLGGVRLGPSSAKPFWDQSLALLGTRKSIVDLLPASATLSWVLGWTLPVCKAVPAPYRIECCGLARLLTPCAIFLPGGSYRIPAMGKQPSPLSPCSTGGRTAQATWQGCCGYPMVPVPHPWPCPSLCSCFCMWMLHVWSGAWMLDCPTACPFW